MKINLLNDTSRTANPSPEALRGYSLDKELRAAVRSAVKPLAKKLHTFRSERARLEANAARWSPAAYNAKLDEITARAHAGDAEAVTAIEAGAVPSRQSFTEMYARAYRELEICDQQSRDLFKAVLPLVEAPMTAAVDKGQQILDDVLAGLGVPHFELTGWRNHISYVMLQIGAASRGETADLDWFWSSIE
jgi:hypothetical protein